MKLIIKTSEDLAAEAEANARAAVRAAALTYLSETDWMVMRAAETGKPVPPPVAEARAAARKAASA